MKKQNFKETVPPIFQNVSYENDVSDRIKEITTQQIRKGRGVYLWGEPGTGKTHTAWAIAKNLIENGYRVLFLNTAEFLERVRKDFDREFEYDEKGVFEEAMDFEGVLFLDDVGAEKASPWVIDRISLIVNHRYEFILPTFFTSNCDMEILSERMGDRVTSRILGMVEVLQKSGIDRRLS